MLQTTPREARGQELDSSSQPSTSRRPGSRVRKSAPAAAVAAASLTPVVVWSLRSSPRAIPALMDLALPRFATPELQSERPRSPWIVTSESPASLPPLGTLSSDGLAGPGDVSAHPISISDVSSHSGDPDQVLSDDDLPPEVRVVDLPPEVRVVDLPPEVRVDFVSPVTPPVSARMLPCSPPEVSLVQSADSSVAISPNRVRSYNSPDILDAEPMFEVSSDTSGFLMRPSGAAVQAPLGCLPLQPGSKSDCAPVLGELVAFTLSGPIPGSDALPMTFPVYHLPSGLALLPVPPSAQTVLASGVSSRPDMWSSDMPRTYDVSCRARLTLIVRRWILGIAHWLLRACRAIHIGLSHILARRSQILIQHMGCIYITPGS